ncbi:MAG: fumarylacetoacetate hydrolase family protein [Euzebyales bacterium]|nr:fumarylacetoacetate hydrolase family protein [Euzebyales bacterium]
MRIVRVARPGGPAFGLVRGDLVVLLDGHPFADFTLTDQVAPLARVRLLAPVLPSKVLCAGKNYADHAAEMGGQGEVADGQGRAGGVPDEPLIFCKPATSVIGAGDDIRLPALSDEVHHEAELAVVIGRLTRRVAVKDAHAAVLGYTCANDVTARDLQRRDGQWTRAKGFDTFCPLGPWIDTDVDPADGLTVSCTVGGELRQNGSTADMVFDVSQLVAYCAAFATLLPGDVILTGTPAGVGPLRDGDRVTVAVEGVGELTNTAVAEAP